MAYDFSVPNVDWDELRRQRDHEESMKQAAQVQELAGLLREAQAPQQNPQMAPSQVEAMSQIQPGQVQQPLPMPENGLAATVAPYTTLDMAGRLLGQEFYNLKNAHRAATQAGNMEEANRIHDAAVNLRNYGAKYGIDVSRFGENVGIDELGALLKADTARGLADVTNMKTSKEYYYDVLDKYKAQGVSDRRAQRMAIDDTLRYEGELGRKLQAAMPMYGANDQGEMNKFGAMIASYLYGNDPSSMVINDRYLVSPADQWKFNKELEAAGYMNGLQSALSRQNFEQTRGLKQDEYNFRGNEADKSRAHDISKLYLNNGFQKDMAAFAAGLDVDKQDALMQLYQKYGIDPAAVFGKGKYSKNGGEDISDKDKIDVYNAQDIYRSGLSLVGEDVENAIAELQKMKTKEDDLETRIRLDGMGYALQARREAEAWNSHGQRGGYDNFLKYYQWAVDNNAYDLVKDLEELYNAARREKERAEKAAEPKETPKRETRTIPQTDWYGYKPGQGYRINMPNQ